MLRFIHKASEPVETSATLTLTLETRIKSRLRVTLDDGREAGLFLPRGSSLRDGDCLITEDGMLAVMIRAAAETVSGCAVTTPFSSPAPVTTWATGMYPLQIEAGLCVINTTMC